MNYTENDHRDKTGANREGSQKEVTNLLPSKQITKGKNDKEIPMAQGT